VRRRNIRDYDSYLDFRVMPDRNIVLLLILMEIRCVLILV
jgi:hypothetical protein